MFNSRDFIQNHAPIFTKLSDAIWAAPELYFQEKKAKQYTEKALIDAGFTVTTNIANLETAILGEFGNGPTVIAFLGEYDALPQLSQKGGATQFEPLEKNGPGHGCGHNLLGSGAFAAACTLKAYVEQTNAPITVRFYGCPAEEFGSGKAYMTKEGVFDDVDLAITWHPWYYNNVFNMRSLANYAVKFKFTGISSHAAASPHLGRSALDAVELMNVGVNYLREHVEPEVRMHYAVTNTGGSAPNIVQQYAEVSYLIRAPRKKQVVDVLKRVEKVAHGAALMTETSVEVEFEGAASDLIPNKVLAEVMQAQLEKAGDLHFTEEEYKFADSLFQTFDENVKEAAFAQFSQNLGDKRLVSTPGPLMKEMMLFGSTDVGDVSWKVPTAQVYTTCWAFGTPAHTWQVVSIGNTTIAHKGMLYAAEIMANTAIAAIENPEIIEQAKQELMERLNGESYQSLIPDEKR